MTNVRQLRRRGLPVMSDKQMGILRQLRTSKAEDTPFIALPGVHRRTLNSMINYDWIFESPGLDGIKYTITKRGEDALAVYEAPSPRHSDGLCPDCRQRPLFVYATGRVDSYCLECKKKRNHKTYRTAAHHPHSLICPQCGERPRQQYKHGRYHAYCKECRHANRAEEKRRSRERDLERARSGEFLPCRRCKVCPRRVFPTYVDDYCAECSREYHYQYRRRREFEKAMQK